MFYSKLQIHVKARFKFYPHIVCDDNKTLWQLPHFKNKRTLNFRKIKYNKNRNSYYINSDNVPYNRLKKCMILTDEIIEVF